MATFLIPSSCNRSPYEPDRAHNEREEAGVVDSNPTQKQGLRNMRHYQLSVVESVQA
jgi:phosphoglycerol transferase MdoB-like AlkP superfamily enzyme